MMIFHSYVELPEGTGTGSKRVNFGWLVSLYRTHRRKITQSGPNSTWLAFQGAPYPMMIEWAKTMGHPCEQIMTIPDV